MNKKTLAEKFASRLEVLQGNKEKKDTDSIFWKPSDKGDHVRLIPISDEEPIKEVWIYYFNKGKSLVSPYIAGNHDPIQTLINRLKDEGYEKNKDLPKKLYPQKRGLALVYVRGKEDEGIKIWNYGKTVMTALYTILKEEAFAPVLDVNNGFDLLVQRLPKRNVTSSGVTYDGFTIQALPAMKPLASTPEKIQELLESKPNVDDYFKGSTTEEAKEYLAAFKRKLESGEDDEEEITINYSPKHDEDDDEVVAEDSGQSKVSSLMQKFDEVKNRRKTNLAKD